MGPNSGENQGGGTATVEAPTFPSSTPENAGTTEVSGASSTLATQETSSMLSGAPTTAGTSETSSTLSASPSQNLGEAVMPSLTSATQTEAQPLNAQSIVQPVLGEPSTAALNSTVEARKEEKSNVKPDQKPWWHPGRFLSAKEVPVAPDPNAVAAAANQESTKLSSEQMDAAMKQGAMEGKAILEPAPDSLRAASTVPDHLTTTPQGTVETKWMGGVEPPKDAAPTALAGTPSAETTNGATVDTSTSTGVSIDAPAPAVTPEITAPGMPAAEDEPADTVTPVSTDTAPAFPGYGSESTEPKQDSSQDTLSTPPPAPEIVSPSAPAPEDMPSSATGATDSTDTNGVPEYHPSDDLSKLKTENSADSMSPTGEKVPEIPTIKDASEAHSSDAPVVEDVSAPAPDASISTRVSPEATDSTLPATDSGSLPLERSAPSEPGTTSPFGSGLPESMGGAATASTTGITATPDVQPEAMPPTAPTIEPAPASAVSAPATEEVSAPTTGEASSSTLSTTEATNGDMGTTDLSRVDQEITGSGAMGQPLAEASATEPAETHEVPSNVTAMPGVTPAIQTPGQIASATSGMGMTSVTSEDSTSSTGTGTAAA